MSQSPSERNTTFQLKRALKAEDECRELQAKIIKMEASIAAARVQMGIECAKFIEGEEDGLPLETLANGIRALIGAKHD